VYLGRGDIIAMKTRLSKWISGLMVASIIWTGAIWTTATVSAASAPFSDVPSGHWAEKHITKLALQGILKGGTNGKFSPNNSVSRQEAVIIALRFMGIADQAVKSDVLVFPSSLVIKEDYKPYIKLAFQKKILLMEEEVALVAKEKGKEWGKSPATREWITRLLVRAIDKDAEAKQQATQATSFSDDSKIDAALRGYVNVAVSSGIVTGVTPTKFDPTATVIRATASTLFSRAESAISVAYNGQVSGALLAITADRLTVLHQDGSVQDYTLTSNTSIYRFDSEKQSTLAGLMLYGKVNLIIKSDKSINYVEQTDDKQQVKTYEGTFTRLTESSNRLTVLIGDNSDYFYYDPQHLPIIKDSNGLVIALKDLPTDVAVKLTVDAVRTDGKIVAVAVKQSVINKSASGTVVAWNSDSRSLQVKDSVSGATDSFTVVSNATIKQNGVNLSLDQLKVGDIITYEVKTGSVSSIVINKSEQPTVTGIFTSVDKTDKTIQYKVGNKLEADYLSDNVKLSIPGLTDATLDDLYKDDGITLSFDANSKVTLITVTNRSVQMLNGAVVAAYVSKTKTLSLEVPSDKPKNLIIGSNVRYDLNGTKLTPEQALPLISTVGKKLNVGYSGDNAITLSIISQYSGVVTENNTSTKNLKLTLDSSGTITIPYGNPTVEIYGLSNKTYSDIHVGDQVTVTLNAAQDVAATVLVHKNVQFEVVTVDTAGNKLRAKRSDGVVDEWTLSAAFKLQDENGAAITLGALSTGSLLNLTFKGNTPIAGKTVTVTIGRVSTVNTASATLDVVTSTGTTVTKAAGATPLILRDNVTLGSLSAVQPDDRVEVRKDENDRTVIQIIPALRKEFWYYDNTTRTLNVQHPLGDSNFSFTLSTTAYIHQGTTSLNVTDMKTGDAISLYVIRGKIVEIVK
jgi:hypothetical protein